MPARIEYRLTLSELRDVRGRIDRRSLEAEDYVLFGHFVSNMIGREEAKIFKLAAKIEAERAAKAADEAGAKTIDVDFKPIASDRGIAGQLGSAESDPASSPDNETNGTPNEEGRDSKDVPPTRGKGHGRNGAAAYAGAKDFFHRLTIGVIGSLCTKCHEARMTSYREQVSILVVGQPMFGAERHHVERCRCKACGRVVSARVPVTQGLGKAVTYHWSAAAMLIVLHYFYGLPFKRMETLHNAWGIPFSDANQWEVASGGMRLLEPMIKALIRYSIQNATSLRMDDTGSMILTLKRQITAELNAAKALGISEDNVRVGINASGFYIKTPSSTIVLYFTGRHHAGEILRELLKHRLPGSPKINKVTDGAAKNFDPELAHLLDEGACNVHAFLYFYDIKAQFPEEYAIVGEAYDKIYENEQIAHERNMSPEDRLAFHRAKSRPWMEKIKALCEGLVLNRLIEPRTPLYAAVHFFLHQWPRLIRFLEVEGMPLDTNLCEQSLIAPVRYLAGSFNYHTEKGAEVGDHGMSLVATARANGVEAVAWLTDCLRNHEDLAKNPDHYFPWAYKKRTESNQQAPPEKSPDPIQ